MKGHICSLKKISGDVAIRNQSWDQKLMYSFRMSRYISTHNPRSQLFYRTNTAILIERQKHINSPYSHIIHPFSIFRTCWEMFMMITFLVYLTLVPVIVAFFQIDEENVYVKIFSYVAGVLDFICIMDIVMTFFTGFTVDHLKQVVLKPRAIASNYLTSSYFILDVVSSTPTELVVYILRQLLPGSASGLIKYINLVALLKVIRVRTLVVYMNRAGELWRINDVAQNFLKYTLKAFLLFHWSGCFQYIVPYYYYYSGNIASTSWIVQRETRKMSTVEQYVECLYKAACQLFCVAHDLYTPISVEDIVLDILIAFIGYCLTGLAMVVFLQLLFRVHISEIKYHSIMNQLRQYMRHKQLPLSMQKRLVDYYDYRFRKSYFRENTIFPTISERLHKDINNYSCMHLMKIVPILKDLPAAISSNIVQCLRQEVFLPNDIIVKAATIGDCMYFIHCGTVAVYTPTGKEVCHLQDGGYFGEMGLIAKDQKRIANVVAIEITEVYRLDRKHFNSYIRVIPDLYKKLERVADGRRENTLVMEEIHRKHILEKTMRMLDDKF